MHEQDQLAARFEADRAHLRAVAYRMLGSVTEAEDAVQEAWFRLSRTDTSDVANLTGWLTTVVSRVCLDALRARRARPEQTLTERLPDPVVGRLDEGVGGDPAHEAVLADGVGLALLVVLDSLAPPERLAYVLHDMFGLPFDEIAPMVDRTPAATRQLASRPAGGSRAGLWCPTGPSASSGRWSRPSSPPPATATSTGSSPCSTPTWCCAPTAARAPSR